MKRHCIFLFVFTLSVLISFGQASELDKIKNDSLNIDSTKIYTIGTIKIIGNKKTKAAIILRELSLQTHDTIIGRNLTRELEQSRKNILNTSLFNYTSINFVENQNYIDLYIFVEERWYFFPFPILEIDDTNFNTWWKTKDFSRINYGIYTTLQNVRGRNETAKLTLQLGYEEKVRLSYSFPYINKAKNLGLGASFSYSRKHQIPYLSFDNERLQYRDEEEYAFQNKHAGIDFQYRGRIFNRHTINLSYNQVAVSDTIHQLNPRYLDGNKSRTEYFSIAYYFTRDRRDSRSYPLEGHYLSVDIRKYGLGILNKNLDFINSGFQFRKYFKLSERFTAAASVASAFSFSKNTPYFLENGLGYRGGVRGYEYYIVDGQNIGISKLQLRYNIFRPRIYRMSFIPLEKFSKMHFSIYSSIFTDFGYVEDKVGYPQNKLANDILFGSGISFDFVTYYDMVLRTEFSVNKLGESGIFIHFVAPI